MTRLWLAFLLLPLGLIRSVAAQEEQEAAVAASPTLSDNLNPAELENWFFSFLERFLNLIAGFILQIIEGTFGAIAGVF